MPQMDQAALAGSRRSRRTGTPRTRGMGLLLEQHYVHHVLRMPPADRPIRCSARSRTSTRRSTCPCKAPASSASAPTPAWPAGRRIAELASIDVPALVIGAQHDTMDPAHMEMMARRLPRGRYLHCPDGSHMAMYDDQVPTSAASSTSCTACRAVNSGGGPDGQGGVGGCPLLAVGGQQRRGEIAQDRIEGLRAGPVEQPGHVRRCVTGQPFAVDLGEALPLLRGERGVDQGQAVSSPRGSGAR